MSQDRCCYWCKSPFGCMNHQCQHHKDAEKQAEADAKARRTHKDPTADRAIARADRARKKHAH